MKYFNVSFKYSDSVYCSNIARADSAADVEAQYSKYEWFKVSEATDADVRSAQERGKPIVTCEHVKETAEPQEAAEAVKETAEPQEAAEAVKEARAAQKIAARLEKFRATYIEMVQEIRTGKEMHVSISAGNVKMGAVASVSTLPIMTCPAICRGTCAADCYAAKIAALRPSVLQAYARNTALAILRPAQYWTEVRDAIAGARFFRFHVSGDILNADYFAEMVRCAVDFPHCDLIAFTKRFDVVNTWIQENGPLPQNLHVLFSGWENMTPDNPHNLPETTVYDTDADLRPDWIPCSGNCHACAVSCKGCFSARPGDTIAFKKH